MNEKQLSKKSTCHLLTNNFYTKKLEKFTICLDDNEKSIKFMKGENSNTVKIEINYQNIEEIREGLKTDAWINSEKNLDNMLDRAQIGQVLGYYSIIRKSNQRVLPGETHDFVTAEKELVEALRELNNKLKDTCKDVSADDCLFDSNLTHDMNQPMSHYFIASSHNTYLSKFQIGSSSSYEIYRNILRDGCRCIEIDIWEGKTEPVVTHALKTIYIYPIGYKTLRVTGKLLLAKVLEIINDFAFVSSEYPLILSIENHLEKRSQKLLAKMLFETFGNQLYVGKIGDCETQHPRLSEMKGKIFIKDYKKLQSSPKASVTAVKIVDSEYLDSIGHLNDVTLTEDESDLCYEDYDYDEWDSDEVDDLDDEKHYQQYLDETSSKYHDGLSCWGSTDSLDLNYNGPTYSEMINYFEANKFKDIQKCITEFKFNQMFSRSETESLEILEQSMISDQNKYRQFTRTHMVRVYPWGGIKHGGRQNSSNYNPVRHWYAGAQMVALNYQTMSVEMQINWAQFELNKGCGYVLKPEYLRSKTVKEADISLKIVIVRGEFENPFSVGMNTKLKVTTRVYCPDTTKHTKVLKRDKYSEETKETKIITYNGINPVWNDSVEYRLANPELSFVLFSLINGEKNTVGEYMIAVQAMRTGGLRSIDLYDDKMIKKPGAKIYVKVDICKI